MNPWIIVVATLAGYLCGSVSFPRLMTRWLAPKQPIRALAVPVPGSAEEDRPTVYGAYNASLVLGVKYGILISVLDMAKVALPTLAFKLYAPHQVYYLLASVAGLAGHAWPLYHKFKGGRGFTAIIGGFLAVDPLGVPVTILAGMLFGMAILRSMYAAYSLWLPLMIPWMWLRTHELAPVLWALALNLVFFVATIPEIKSFAQMQREGTQKAHDQAHIDTHPMWRTMARLTERLRLGGRH